MINDKTPDSKTNQERISSLVAFGVDETRAAQLVELAKPAIKMEEELVAARAEIARLEAICVDHYNAHSAASTAMARMGMTGDVKPGKMLTEALAENARLKEVASWAQALLTALNVGNVEKGSPLHLKLREVMIEYRKGQNE